VFLIARIVTDKLLYFATLVALRGIILKIRGNMYEGWNFNSGNYLFTTDTK